MLELRAFLIAEAVILCFFGGACAAAQGRDAGQGPTWLWVMDQHTGLGVPRASIEIGTGKECLKGEKTSENVTWTAHYRTGPAGRVLIDRLPQQFSCRVTLSGRELPVESTGRSGPRTGSAALATLFVDLENRGVESVESDYWRTTNNPTKFRDYIQDDEDRLIAGVQVRALRSGITTISDANGLFTLEVPTNYRKGKPPSIATETLIFSKRGYRTLEYRDLVLKPDVNQLSIRLEKGSGTVVRRNRSLSNGEYDSFSFAGKARELPDGYAGEIDSFEIEPSIFDGGWTLAQRGARGLLKGRNLRSVEVFFYSTGTGIGEMGPGSAGQMRKVRSSPKEDTWELPLPDVMTTNFWAEAVDASGKTIKSMDVGNVACGIGLVQ